MIGTDLGVPLSTFQKELITSATTCGALLGGLVAGAASDYTGRKGVLAFANIVFVLGAGLQAACHTVRSMVVGRFIVGVGVGLASCIAPLYVGELAPTRQRGRLVTINAVACTLGQVVAYGERQLRWPTCWTAADVYSHRRGVCARSRRLAMDGRARRRACRRPTRRPRLPPRKP